MGYGKCMRILHANIRSQIQSLHLKALVGQCPYPELQDLFLWLGEVLPHGNTRAESMDYDPEGLRQELYDAESDMCDLRSDNSNLKSKVGDLESRVRSLETDLKRAMSDLSDLETEREELREKLSDLLDAQNEQRELRERLAP